MNISVLGPLAATVGEVSVVPTAAKPRTLLALLASYSGHVVPADVIVAELWGDAPPPSAATTTQTYILQLRRLIRGAVGMPDGKRAPRRVKEILRTEPPGYRLDQSGGAYDATDHEGMAAAGYKAMQAGDFPTARLKLNSALHLWRGPAFVDVQTGPRLSALATLLEESRKTILERRIEADLRLGCHHEVIGELAGLTAEHATDERLHAHFMIALYRAGRRSRALTVFRQLRSALARELGLEPSSELEQLHHAMLVADPALANAPAWTVPLTNGSGGTSRKSEAVGSGW